MPLRDFSCAACTVQAERFYHATVGPESVACAVCGNPMTMADLSAGRITGKTGVFPFVMDFGDGTKRTVESLSHLRTYEKRFGVMATTFSNHESNPDSPKDIPEYRPGGRAYEGFRFPDHVKRVREEGIRAAVRAVETGKYRR